MRTVSESEVVRLFADAMAPLIALPPATGTVVFEAFARFHRQVRVRGVEDGVLLEWGVMTPPRLTGFVDLRVTAFDWATDEYQWLGLSRQLKTNRGDGDAALRTFVYFDRPTGDEESSNIECDGLDESEEAFRRFIRVPYVAGLLARRPSRVTAFKGEVG